MTMKSIFRSLHLKRSSMSKESMMSANEAPMIPGPPMMDNSMSSNNNMMQSSDRGMMSSDQMMMPTNKMMTKEQAMMSHQAIAMDQSHSMSANNQNLQVVELFQSQGCSSCPPANQNIIELSADPNYLVLTYHVTYWDQLGWTDTFGNGKFDRRQREYCEALQRRSAFTPQVIVNGISDGVGNTQKELNQIIKSGRREQSPFNIEVTTNSVKISSQHGNGALVSIVRYDPQHKEVYIERGENGNQTLPHINIVQDVNLLGPLRSNNQEFSLPKQPKGVMSERVVIIQTGVGGPIVAAAKV